MRRCRNRLQGAGSGSCQEPTFVPPFNCRNKFVTQSQQRVGRAWSLPHSSTSASCCPWASAHPITIHKVSQLLSLTLSLPKASTSASSLAWASGWWASRCSVKARVLADVSKPPAITVLHCITVPEHRLHETRCCMPGSNPSVVQDEDRGKLRDISYNNLRSTPSARPVCARRA